MSTTDNWALVTIEQCCEILDSKRIPINADEREKRIGDIPYYGANGLQGFIDDFIFDEPLILIAEDGGRFDDFRTSAIAYRVFGKSWVNNHAHVLRAKSEFCQDAIFYSLEHKDIRSFIVGGTRSKLNQGALRAITLFLPNSKEEQTKIAEILWTVDNAIERTKELISKQQRIKTGLMQNLLTRGIDEHGNIRSEQTHQFKDSALGRIPVEWEVTELGSVAELVTSGSRGWAQYYSAEGATFLRIGNLTREHINLRMDNLVYVCPPKSSEGRRTSVASGDILISITADLGIIGVIPEHFGEGYVNQHIALIRLLPTTEVNSRFVGWYLAGQGGQSQFEKLNESGAKAGLNLPTIRKLLFPLMNASEQVKISGILDSISKSISDLYSQLYKLRSLKTALMQDLLTGKRRVDTLLNDTEVMVNESGKNTPAHQN
ncbi:MULTISPECIES: restriction endonuclease subunit S [Brevibacillus]|uniref:restriction endonuclease subunit S n=1 Tax=Brevibacillus TaxID=55080 RepID=UPI003633D2E5